MVVGLLPEQPILSYILLFIDAIFCWGRCGRLRLCFFVASLWIGQPAAGRGQHQPDIFGEAWVARRMNANVRQCTPMYATPMYAHVRPCTPGVHAPTPMYARLDAGRRGVPPAWTPGVGAYPPRGRRA